MKHELCQTPSKLSIEIDIFKLKDFNSNDLQLKSNEAYKIANMYNN